jgi:glycosyltransferase involved in cell wall biosynthesis
MDSCPQVISIIENYLGHRTYGHLMREYFSRTDSCNVDFYWLDEDQELTTRILNKLLNFYFPNKWVQQQNLDLHWFRFQIAIGYAAKRLVSRKLALNNFTALHLHTHPLAFFLIDLMNKLPTVVTVDLTSQQRYRERTTPSFKWTYAPNFFLERKVFEAAAQVVTLSEWARQSVIEEYNIDEKKVKVIHSGININAIRPLDSSKKGIQKRYKILFVGGDFERKGGQDILEVFSNVFSNEAELHLVTHASIKCSNPNVYIYNDVKAYTTKWLELYQQANVFVLPTYADPFPTVFMEAMAAGLPVIASRLSQIIEIVRHEETGFLVQPGDRRELACRIRQLMENPILAREMGAKGRKVVERQFNAEKNFQSLEFIFREVSGCK